MAIGVWSAVAAIGAATGPVLGGFLVEHFWWGSVFLINIPLMAVMPAPRPSAYFPSPRADRDGPWDVVGALMAAVGMLGVVYGVKRLGVDRDLLDPSAVGPLLVGAAVLIVFVRRQQRREHPLVDMTDVRQARLLHLGRLHRPGHARPGRPGADRRRSTSSWYSA